MTTEATGPVTRTPRAFSVTGMERDHYAAGTPSWIDIGSPDLDVTHAFYTALFGWEREDAGPVEETGGYGFLTQGGPAGGGGGRGHRAGVWGSMYVSVGAAAAIAGRVAANGGSTIVAPMQVMEAGSMAVVGDPDGAAVAVWESGPA